MVERLRTRAAWALLALVAPRALYVSSATEDWWSDPPSEFRACVEAGRVYRLFGLAGLGTRKMPRPEEPVLGDGMGYYLRTGRHGMTEYDWDRFMDFADGYHKGRHADTASRQNA